MRHHAYTLQFSQPVGKIVHNYHEQNLDDSVDVVLLMSIYGS
jgi:hypothetical protein